MIPFRTTLDATAPPLVEAEGLALAARLLERPGTARERLEAMEQLLARPEPQARFFALLSLAQSPELSEASGTTVVRWREVAGGAARQAEEEAAQEGLLWTPELDTLASTSGWTREPTEDPRRPPRLEERLEEMQRWIATQRDPRSLHPLLHFRSPLLRLRLARSARVLDETLVSGLGESLECAEALLLSPALTEALRGPLLLAVHRSGREQLLRHAAGDARPGAGRLFTIAEGERKLVGRFARAGFPEPLRREMLGDLSDYPLPRDLAELLIRDPGLSPEELLTLARRVPEDIGAQVLLHPQATPEVREAVLGDPEWGFSAAYALFTSYRELAYRMPERVLELCYPQLARFSLEAGIAALGHPAATPEMWRDLAARYTSAEARVKLLVLPGPGRDPEIRREAMRSRARSVMVALLRYAGAEEFGTLVTRLLDLGAEAELKEALERAEVPSGLPATAPWRVRLLASPDAGLRLVAIRRLGEGVEEQRTESPSRGRAR